MKLSIITPAYKEGAHIYRNLQELMRAADELNVECEIIVVADGQMDNTYEEACRLASETVKVFQYRMNRGKGFALCYGFQRSRGEIVVFIDADMDLPPSQIKSFVEAMSTREVDMAVGSKRHPLSKVSYPLQRRVYSRCYQAMLRCLFQLKVTDTQVGIKAFRREALEAVLPRIVVKRYAFDLEMLVVARHLGFSRIAELPVELHYQFTGSGINRRAIINMLRDTLAIYYRLVFMRHYDRSDVMPFDPAATIMREEWAAA